MIKHPWGPELKLRWFTNQSLKRSYRTDVLTRLDSLQQRYPDLLTIQSYGTLSFAPEKYPLYAVRVGEIRPSLPTVLVTGGVHGYETSGVKGALKFLEEKVASLSKNFNIVVAPCVSPWSYETINRLDPVMENPNREFKDEGKSEESAFLMKYLTTLGVEIDGHIDLHETTDSDKIFLPEEYSKNGKELSADAVDIPDGFYLIGVKGQERPELDAAIIRSVEKVTHIAPPDAKGEILDTKITSPGVIYNDIPGLCAQYTQASKRLGAYTTEVYPDSPKYKGSTPEAIEDLCVSAQLAALSGAFLHWS